MKERGAHCREKRELRSNVSQQRPGGSVLPPASPMKAFLLSTVALTLFATQIIAADLPPGQSSEIPASAKRPVVLTLAKQEAAKAAEQKLEVELPPGMELKVAAAAPLVTHPMMACLDEKGRLFVGDAVGANWNKKQLEANPPNRILMLEDTDGDGVYDKSTVFADKMTFPQGGCWFNGSLYVCSPPSLWKLTDTNGDGVADKREELVTGFEYTGNAADVHGPWLHPNGRLYWCHGRKGHRVVGKDGKVVHEGLASGIWSCKPDGTDVQWHSLGCGDNPVKVDFTPEGEVVGVQNLYYSQPRGDTIVHWLHGGVYERADQMKAIEGLPRTLEHMPVMYNFGHVAVSGCTFYRSGTLFPSHPLQLLVTHFNTQRVVRMELTEDGASYKAISNEFLKMHDPNVHLTDVIEDPRDGSLLVVNTGGWFRIGCPSSLMAKPDLTGTIYRVKKRGTPSLAANERKAWFKEEKPWADRSVEEIEKTLTSSPDNRTLLEVYNGIVQKIERGENLSRTPLITSVYTSVSNWSEDDPVLEHTATLAFAKLLDQTNDAAISTHTRKANDKRGEKIFQLGLITRAMLVESRLPKSADESSVEHQQAKRLVWQSLVEAALNGAEDEGNSPHHAFDLQPTNAVVALLRSGCAIQIASQKMHQWLAAKNLNPAQLEDLVLVVSLSLAQPEAQDLLTVMLAHPSREISRAAVGILANQSANISNKAWFPALEKMMVSGESGDLPLLLDAMHRLKSSTFDASLQAIANDTRRPLAIRLKALDAVKGLKLTPETFGLLQSVLTNTDSSAAARIQAAGMLAHAPLQKDQLAALSPLLASAGPLELKSLLSLVAKCKDGELARTISLDLAKNPVINSQQESVYRTAFSAQPPALFESIVLPALRKANEASDAKMRRLAPLAERVMAEGDPKAGKLIYESGKSVCIACHQIGDKGRAIGPNLSHIGAIRTERDLLESIIFPSNTLARDYEAHVIETSDGQNLMGVIKSHTADGLLLVDAAGQEKSISDSQIVANTTLTTSLMPMGLDQTLSEKELCDLVAWLRSLK